MFKYLFFKKFLPLFIIGLFVVQPAWVQAEEYVFPDATSTVELVTTTALTEAPSSTEPTLPVRELIPEPTIRVGLYKTGKPVEVKSDFVYEIWSGSQSWGVVNPGQTIELSYHKGLYTVKSSDLEFGSKEYVRLIPVDANSFFTINSYSRLVPGRSKLNFNAYRGALEYRFSPKSGLPYMINELPLEMYIRGVAEVNDVAPTEFIKALSVAARSYAYAMIGKAPATDKRLFDVYATTVDQLYLGYNSEIMMPNFVSAATATAGEMVTYKDNPVITFYFTRSNGSTKSAGLNRPWLKSVEAKYDKGKTKLGHGLGMSNQDALQRAKKDGWDYKQILQHYYSDVEIEHVY